MKFLGIAPVVCVLCGCQLASKLPLKTDFDLGPPGASVPSEQWQDGVVVYAVTAPAWLDQTSMYYRLNYRNDANPMPYTRSQWLSSPATLVTERLKSGFVATGVTQAPGSAYTLHAQLIDFEQIYEEPNKSRGVLRLHATLSGKGFRVERLFAFEEAAPTSNAEGGVAALTHCSEELVTSMRAWIATSIRSVRAQEQAKEVIEQQGGE